MRATVDYLAPGVPPRLPWHETRIVRATDALLKGYGRWSTINFASEFGLSLSMPMRAP